MFKNDHFIPVNITAWRISLNEAISIVSIFRDLQEDKIVKRFMLL